MIQLMKISKFLLLGFAILILSFDTQTKKKILFFGDSITWYGIRPGGYITKLDSMLRQKGVDNVELVGSGVKGNKIYDLYLRMEDDVLAQHPDVVVIWIGVNDVWHKDMFRTGTDADKFEKFYEAILKKLREAHIVAYLCTPAVIGERTDFSNEEDGDLNKYSQIIRGIAQRNNCPLIDFRKYFHEYLEANNPTNREDGVLTKEDDGVHLNVTGNIFVAEKIYGVLGKDMGW